LEAQENYENTRESALLSACGAIFPGKLACRLRGGNVRFDGLCSMKAHVSAIPRRRVFSIEPVWLLRQGKLQDRSVTHSGISP
jgi:hypothetical protein